MAHADTVFVNGKVVTVDKDFSYKQAVAVKDGWIVDTGYSADMKAHVGPGTEVVDLKGKIILPACHDAHMHGVWYGVTKSPLCLDLTFPAVKDFGDIREALRKKCAELPAGQWIKGVGWNGAFLAELQKDPERLPRKTDFDDVSPNHPIALYDFSLHTLVVNSKALEMCRITKETKDPPSGEMERDSDGEPTGVFKEFAAHGLIMEHFPTLSYDELEAAIRITQNELNQNGYASYNESSLGPGGNLNLGGVLGEPAIHAYKTMQDKNLLTCRVTVGLLMGEYGALSYDDVVSGFEKIRLPELTDKNWLDIPMLKIFADGIPTNFTSWLNEDYKNNPGNHGRACLPGATDDEQEEELHKIILLAHQKGYQVAIHATGDRALDASLRGFIKAIEAYPGISRRHYTIHGDMITNQWARKAAKYDCLHSLQPAIGAFLYDALQPFLGRRASRIYGLKELFDCGLSVAGGSDCPVSMPNWRQGVQAAVTRKADATGNVHCPELALTVEEGIRLFTYNGAYQEHMEKVRGSIEPNKVADLQVLDADIFAVDPDEIGKVGVEMTMVGGKVVHQK